MPIYQDGEIRLPKKDHSRGDLPDSLEDWVDYVNKLHDQALLARRKYEFQWLLNTCYYLGYHNLVYRDGVIQLPTEQRQPLTLNRLASFIESRHAKLTKSRPMPRVLPSTTDREDLNAAKYSDKSLLHLWRKTDLESEYDRLIMQMLLCNVSFLECLWDPFAGDVIKEPIGKDDKILSIDREGDVETEDVFMGEISSRVCSTFDLLIANDKLTKMRDQAWVMKRLFMDISDLETRYPALIGKIKKADPTLAYTDYEKILMRLSSPVFSAVGQSHEVLRDAINTQALVKVFMMKPNYQYKKGLVIVLAGDEAAMAGPIPNDYGPNIYPWFKFQEKEIGFHFYGQATCERVIPVQRAYNELKEKTHKNIRRMANGKWLLAKGSQVAKDAIDDDSGEILEWNSAVPAPQQAALAPLPNYVANHTADLVNDFREVANQKESALTPGQNITASIAMETQAELSDEALSPIVKRLQRAMMSVAQCHLLLMNQEYLEPRQIKIFGEDGKIGVEWVSAADLRNQTDVHIEIESMFPELRGGKRQALFDMWDRRIITDAKDFIRAFRYGFDTLLEQEEKLEDAVYLDIQMMKRGKMPQINPLGNHLLSAKTALSFIQTPEFLRLIPERKQAFIEYAQAHLAFVMQQMPAQGQPMAQTNPAATGTPFGPQTPVGAMGGTSGTRT